MSDRRLHAGNISRRAWIGGVALGTVLGRGSAADETLPASRADLDLIQTIRSKAEAAGLKAIESGMSEHYVAVGNAAHAFRKEALDLCEDLAVSVLKHFEFKGFDVKVPKNRLGVVVLADRASYEAFNGDKTLETEGGHYEPASNLLVMFNFLKELRKGGPDVRRLNTFTLVHEATHQLTYNIGLLDPKGDVPVAISEGLATYAETWQRIRPQLGLENRHRAQVLKDTAKGVGDPWIEVRDLLTRDGLFEDPNHMQAAYAEAWLLVYEQLRTKAGAKKFQKYLDTIRPRRDPERRLEDAQDAFGNLVQLDNTLKRRVRLLG
jgi:Protein of unknown function (DUF1570)